MEGIEEIFFKNATDGNYIINLIKYKEGGGALIDLTEEELNIVNDNYYHQLDLAGDNGYQQADDEQYLKAIDQFLQAVIDYIETEYRNAQSEEAKKAIKDMSIYLFKDFYNTYYIREIEKNIKTVDKLG